MTRWLLLLSSGALLLSPTAHADNCQTDECRAWYNSVSPIHNPSVTASIDANAPRAFSPAAQPGMWQVYAVPVGVMPGPQHFCGVMPIQQPAPQCPPGLEYWYR